MFIVTVSDKSHIESIDYLGKKNNGLEILSTVLNIHPWCQYQPLSEKFFLTV